MIFYSLVYYNPEDKEINQEGKLFENNGDKEMTKLIIKRIKKDNNSQSDTSVRFQKQYNISLSEPAKKITEHIYKTHINYDLIDFKNEDLDKNWEPVLLIHKINVSDLYFK